MSKLQKNIRRAFTVLSLTIALAIVFSGGSLASKTYQVKVSYDGVVADYETKTKTVGEFFAENGISVPEDAKMDATFETRTKDDLTIHIQTKKNIRLSVGGRQSMFKTYEYTTEGVLADAKIKVENWNHVSPSKNALITNNSEITVDIYEVIQDIQEETVAFKETEKKDSSMYKDEKKIIKKGINGITKKYYEVQLKNGEKLSSQLIKTEEVKKAVDQVTLVGTKEKKIAGVGTFSKIIDVLATAYDSSFESNGHWGAVTALGTPLRPGVVAVDPNVIPLGSRLYVECEGWSNYGIAIAEDTGSAIIGKRIDLYFADTEKAYDFGRRNAKVYILD